MYMTKREQLENNTKNLVKNIINFAGTYVSLELMKGEILINAAQVAINAAQVAAEEAHVLSEKIINKMEERNRNEKAEMKNATNYAFNPENRVMA